MKDFWNFDAHNGCWMFDGPDQLIEFARIVLDLPKVSEIYLTESGTASGDKSSYRLFNAVPDFGWLGVHPDTYTNRDIILAKTRDDMPKGLCNKLACAINPDATQLPAHEKIKCPIYRIK